MAPIRRRLQSKVQSFSPPEEMAATDVTMDLDVLDCQVCCQPLRPQVFQCTVGHTLCSTCHQKLPKKCHFCSRPRESRCHMVEDIIDSIKVACSNGNHGCTERITYYQKEDHEKSCPHAPCFCPEAGCSFSGSTVMLQDHFSSKHKWRSIKVTYNTSWGMDLQVGSTVLVGEDGHMFLLNVRLNSLGGFFSVCCIQPHITGSKFKCKLTLSCHKTSHSHEMEFTVRSTNLHDGLPKDYITGFLPKLPRSDTSASAIAKMSMWLTVVLTPQ